MGNVANLEALLASGTDNPQLRFGLATALAREQNFSRALAHAEVAVELDRDYSAAWRLLGQLHEKLGNSDAAIAAFERGIEVAERRGDQQLVKEMRVFLRRLRKRS